MAWPKSLPLAQALSPCPLSVCSSVPPLTGTVLSQQVLLGMGGGDLTPPASLPQALAPWLVPCGSLQSGIV